MSSKNKINQEFQSYRLTIEKAFADLTKDTQASLEKTKKDAQASSTNINGNKYNETKRSKGKI
jgi:hypothetical protein